MSKYTRRGAKLRRMLVALKAMPPGVVRVTGTGTATAPMTITLTQTGEQMQVNRGDTAEAIAGRLAEAICRMPPVPASPAQPAGAARPAARSSARAAGGIHGTGAAARSDASDDT